MREKEGQDDDESMEENLTDTDATDHSGALDVEDEIIEAAIASTIALEGRNTILSSEDNNGEDNTNFEDDVSWERSALVTVGEISDKMRSLVEDIFMISMGSSRQYQSTDHCVLLRRFSCILVSPDY